MRLVNDDSQVSSAWFVFFSILLCALLLMVSCEAQAYTDEEAIESIIGESASEPDSMKHIAHAIRNRGTLSGVYGLKNPYVKRATGQDWQRASKAWYESENELDPTNGANHWHAVEKEGKVYWQDKCVETIKSGSHTYFNCPWSVK